MKITKTNQSTETLTQLHTSLTPGYISKKAHPNGVKYKYDGRFGKGIYTLTHNPDSTRFCWKTYFVEN